MASSVLAPATVDYPSSDGTPVAETCAFSGAASDDGTRPATALLVVDRWCAEALNYTEDDTLEV